MGNLDIFNKLKNTPKEARKTIEAGRLAGFTDINPMHRIKRLTEVFGACGTGWKPVVTKTQILEGGKKYYEKGKGETYRVEECTEVCVFMDLLLYYRKEDGEWSDGVPGFGGANIVTAEKFAPYTDNDAFKKAFTDALGNACKNLGMSADIYYSKDENSKYGDCSSEEVDAFKTYVTKSESLKIVNKAKEKWGAEAPEKCSEILKKYGATSTLEVLQIYLDSVLKEIENA